MSDKVFHKARWYRDVRRGGFTLVAAGYYDMDAVPEAKQFIDEEDLYTLIAALDEAGLIQPRLDERLRVEDLRITHRLLDLLDRSVAGPR